MKVNKGDLVFYKSISLGEEAYGIVINTGLSEGYVTVAWMDDGLETSEPISNILSQDEEFSYMELIK